MSPRPIPNAYWWAVGHNWGDFLTPLLLAHYAHTLVQWSPPADSDLIVVGSILDLIPAHGYRGIVAGAGKLRATSQVDLSEATVLGLRGPLSLEGVTGVRGDPVLGDPGLLADELVRVDKKYELGLLPHWSDRDLEYRPEFVKYEPHIIRPNGNALHVVEEIGRCHKLITSSLHGVILADAFGIQRRTEMAAAFAREGHSLKFEDYNATVGVEFKVGKTQWAPRYIVEERRQLLIEMLESVGRRLMGDDE